MGQRYLEVKAEREPGVDRETGRASQQLLDAQRTADDVPKLVEDFLETVHAFEREHRPDTGEAFHDSDGRKDLYEDPNYVGFGQAGTNLIAGNLSRLGPDRQPVGPTTGHDLPDLTYLDRELVPTRSKTHEVEYEGGGKGERVRLDLLFGANYRKAEGPGGQIPVVAEVKALGDESVYYALIQGLNCCAQLSSGAQRERLSNAYESLDPELPMELWIVLAEHNSRGPEKEEMARLARQIAEQFIDAAGIGRYLAAIRCVDTEIDISFKQRDDLMSWAAAPTKAQG